MFLGEYQHSLDTKGRVILPARFRDQLAEGAFVTKGRGGCLFVFTPKEFEEVATTVREQSKRGAKELNAARVFFSGASEATPDKQGRVALPASLRNYAGLDPRRRGAGGVLPHRDMGPRPVVRARSGGRPGTHRLRRPARIRYLTPTLDRRAPRGRHQPPG